MTVDGYGQMRATDADRDNVHSVLQTAYSEGRLTWDEFDTRSTALVQAKTYAELGALTADLQKPTPYRAVPGYIPQNRTNAMAVTSMCCGLCQVFLPFVAGIPAIICGHIARSQIRETGEEGSGMALAGLILGYIGVLGPILLVLIVIALLAVR
jgi:Domain of unknown function (DUF1707)/Domain of unknown function (DUF4190)